MTVIQAALVIVLQDINPITYIIAMASVLIDISLFYASFSLMISNSVDSKCNTCIDTPSFAVHISIFLTASIWLLANLICTWVWRPVWYVYLASHISIFFYPLGWIIGYAYIASVKDTNDGELKKLVDSPVPPVPRAGDEAVVHLTA